ncbi:uncharacterized protein N7500_008466 [Penicillium coprophilum]|uniref:uncharacterized protein n=1 Tax=Penicillium coprophilum TaxID=36646 RepID=UPI0023A78DEF|nr:uncharacterized protein N7500_008466 [Penicillium coprophilum]KAJ5158815.1 hypothetical protein N7500_008466 [Penicillium coprophilum]
MSDRYNFRRSTRSQKVPPQPPGGSPRDPTRRIKLKIEDLDLDKSYVGISVPAKLPARPKKSRPWTKWEGTKPLTDPARLPHGWHMNEDDLDPADIDGQIDRCLERIAENIMPHVFEQRLKEYTASKAEFDAMIFPGSEELSWEAIQRVHELESMKTDVAAAADQYEQLPNIEAILEEYKSCELEWNIGLVTYWSRGVQICQPRRFDWDEFESINSHFNGDKGFWTEGLTGPEPDTSSAEIVASPALGDPKLIGVKLALRLPGADWFAEFDFVHDKECSMMSIYQADLETLLCPIGSTVGPTIPVVTMARTRVSGGSIITRQVIELETTILDGDRRKMIAWTRTMCSLNPGSWTLSAVPRLYGPILRDLLNQGASPAGRNSHVANTRSGVHPPDLDLTSNTPARGTQYRSRSPMPTRTVAEGYDMWSPGIKRTLAMPLAAPGALR